MPQPIFKPGDRVHVAIGGKYHPDVVASSWEWGHWSGNSYIAYKMESGLCCSANSIMEYADPDWNKRDMIHASATHNVPTDGSEAG